MKRTRGFTLLELVMVLAIIGILATMGVSMYRLYILRAETAQKLIDYGHIRSVVAIETYAGGRQDLHMDSTPGSAPPKLQGLLDDREFSGLDNMLWQLIRAPAGTFASYPDSDVYAILASGNTTAGRKRLLVLRNSLPHKSGDKIWIEGDSGSQLSFPLNLGSASTAKDGTNPPSPPGGESSSDGTNIIGEGTNNSGDGTASFTLCIYGKDGKPLTGQNNTNVRFRIRTKYADFEENLKIDSETGCLSKEYTGLPPGSSFYIELLDVVDYNPPNSGGTSGLWDGKAPSFNVTIPQ